jgi:hypothetical protein
MADQPTPAATPPAGGPPAAPEGETGGQRLDRLEQVQAEQGGKLDKVLELLKGDGEPATAATAGPDIPAMVAKAVADVGAEQARKAADAEHAADHAKLKAPPPEQPPREPLGVRGRIQRRMYGGDS